MTTMTDQEAVKALYDNRLRTQWGWRNTDFHEEYGVALEDGTDLRITNFFSGCTVLRIKTPSGSNITITSMDAPLLTSLMAYVRSQVRPYQVGAMVSKFVGEMA